ncbi:MAG: hypothetical protein ACK2T6_02245 [Anaerolineae bacterium]
MDTRDRVEILRLLEQGEITVAEAEARLGGAPIPPAPADPCEDPPPKPVAVRPATAAAAPYARQEPMPAAAAPASTAAPQWLKIRVTDLGTGRSHVRVNIPLALVRFGLQVGKACTPEVAGIDLEELSAALQSGASGKIIEVCDDEDGEHVEIWIE